MTSGSGGSTVLKVDGLCVGVQKRTVVREVVEDVSFDLHAGEVVALVGGTGCGKTLTARALMGVLPPGVYRTGGAVLFEGRDLTKLMEEERRELLGTRLAMIVQNPQGALHPLRRVGDQLSTVIRARRISSRRSEIRRVSREALEAVRIPDIDRVMRAWPHELSGGMAQRVVIAIALIGKPAVLIADEPTTGLDVTVQAQVLDLIENHINALNASAILVTHDLGVVAQYCERVLVMEAGRLVEDAAVHELFANPTSATGRNLVEIAKSESVAMLESDGHRSSVPETQ